MTTLTIGVVIGCTANDGGADIGTDGGVRYTYREHIQPILEGRCGACHGDLGIGGFSLMSYEHAQTWGDFASRFACGSS